MNEQNGMPKSRKGIKARHDYILLRNCKTNCKTSKTVSVDCSVFIGIPAVLRNLGIVSPRAPDMKIKPFRENGFFVR